MPDIVRPIFIVSMPRSGSTIFHRIMFLHPDIVTTTNSSKKCPTSASLTRFFGRFYYREIESGEGGRMWDKFAKRNVDILEATDVTPKARSYFTRAVAAHLEAFPGTRFLARCPRNGMRLRYFNEIFPDALFVHLVRDGRAVCQSVMRRREADGTLDTWWDVKPEGWEEMAAMDPVSSVASQWNTVVNFIEECGRELGPDRYLQMRYEDLIKSPNETLAGFGSFCGLDCPDPAQSPLIDTLQDRNYKWREVFEPDELTSMNEIMGETLVEHGYTV